MLPTSHIQPSQNHLFPLPLPELDRIRNKRFTRNLFDNGVSTIRDLQPSCFGNYRRSDVVERESYECEGEETVES